MTGTRIIVAATSDLATDQRLRRHCTALHENGCEVTLTGRVLKGSLPVTETPYRTRRVKHLFNRGPLFYAEYNIRLFFFLLFNRFDIINANDLDTLPACYIVSRLRSKPLVYDSHEYFTGVPELTGRPFVRKTWEAIERLIFPGLSHIITVNSSIALIYSEKYGKEIDVVRNLPAPGDNSHEAKPEDFGLPRRKKFVILQGAGINIDRGAEEAVRSMHHVHDAVLVIAGKGDALPVLRRIADEEALTGRVRFIPPMPYEKLMQLTSLCSCGLSLDKDSNLNYRYSLPNKIFDYIIAGIPVVVSSLPETRRIIEQYEVGLIADCLSPKGISEKINEVLSSPPSRWQENLKKAAAELNWEMEKDKLISVYSRIGKKGK